MTSQRISSRLQRIEDRRNKNQALMFILLSIGFVLLLVFVGFPMFIKAAVWLGEKKTAANANAKTDTIAPVPPRIITTYEATPSATIKLSGYSESGTTVTLFRNVDKVTEAVADNDGNFTFPTLELEKGDNNIYVVSKDTAGNESQPSQTITIVYDDEAPELSLSSPNEGAKYFDDEREILVAGETDPDADVKVNGYVVVVDTKGNFVKRLLLNEGENEITVVSKDKAENKIEKKVKVSYNR
jgi:hypothetical protein